MHVCAEFSELRAAVKDKKKKKPGPVVMVYRCSNLIIGSHSAPFTSMRIKRYSSESKAMPIHATIQSLHHYTSAPSRPYIYIVDEKHWQINTLRENKHYT